MNSPTPLTLEGERVRLVPLRPSHAAALWQAGQSRQIWTYMPACILSEADMESFVADTLRQQSLGAELPFAVEDKATGRLIGSTRYLDIAPAHRRLEIGGTWYAPDVWRTHVNTECKLLLLTHAFERLDANRVCLKTDARNVRSQFAIARLGAEREGVLRAHMMLPDGFIRDTVYYSILRDEWPAVKQSLTNALARHAQR